LGIGFEQDVGARLEDIVEFAAPEPRAGVQVDNIAADMAIEGRADVVEDVV
jgi:hypothetical protein